MDQEEGGNRDEEDDDEEKHHPLPHVLAHAAGPPLALCAPRRRMILDPVPYDAPDVRGELGAYDQVEPLTGRLRVVVAIGVALVIAVGIGLRFWASSALWLDEALTVNIARLPLHEIPGRLKQDGAPPLFYYLLHFWMRLFGQSDLATRSLSGILGVLTLPVAWLAAQRFGGRMVAWTTVVLLAERPVRRLLLHRGPHVRLVDPPHRLRDPGPPACPGRTAAGQPDRRRGGDGRAALHPVLVDVPGGDGGLCGWFSACCGPGTDAPESRAWRRPIPALVAVAVGGLAFVPWLPTFIYQSKHTGTPWAAAGQLRRRGERGDRVHPEPGVACRP